MNGLGRPSVRAVVYTRKSSEEGLDQEFNSLDAQYEACTAYIASQRHEGWKLVKQRFDDGGVSGGTMDRPALKALLDEVDKGLIDMIVVYKIDRLTHRCHILETGNDSYRFKASSEAAKTKRKETQTLTAK